MRFLFVILLLNSLLLSAAMAGNKMKVNPYGKYFVDFDGNLTVEMALIDEKNEDGYQDVLLKITGAEAHSEGIDKKVLLYKAVPAGTGVNFVYQKDGNEKTRMLSRASWGSWENFELFVNGKSFKIVGNSKKAKDVKPEKLLSEYND